MAPKPVVPVHDVVGRVLQRGDHVVFAKGGPGTVFGADLDFGKIDAINPKANNGRGSVVMFIASPRFDTKTGSLVFKRHRGSIRADSVFIIPGGLIPPDGHDAIALAQQEWENK